MVLLMLDLVELKHGAQQVSEFGVEGWWLVIGHCAYDVAGQDFEGLDVSVEVGDGVDGELELVGLVLGELDNEEDLAEVLGVFIVGRQVSDVSPDGIGGGFRFEDWLGAVLEGKDQG